MKGRSKGEAVADIVVSMIPVAAAVYHGRKGHKEGFLKASEIYEKKFSELKAQLQQIRIDVFGESLQFICPQSWDCDFWKKKLEVFLKEREEACPTIRQLLLDFLDFCIETFPKRRLAQTLDDLRTVRRVIGASQQELAKLPQEDIQLAIDFLSFYRDDGAVKEIKQELVAVLPNTKGCNFLVLGKTGVGKSSLLNSLLGNRMFDTGTGRPVTTKGIHESEGTLDGIKVRVFDSWGLEAGAVEEWHRMLKDTQEKHDLKHRVEDWFHAVVYCVNAGGNRIEDVDVSVIRSLLADDLYVVVALTKADQCLEEDTEALRNVLCSECEKLRPENVIETCIGRKTRDGNEIKQFGFPELRQAILKNYKETIKAQLPSRCIYLARQKVEAFRQRADKWIKRQEWRYDDNENTCPLREKCLAFAGEFFKEEFPKIVREEIRECSKHGRNFASVLQFGKPIVPDVLPEMRWWGSVGNGIVKTIQNYILWWEGNKAEQARLRAELKKFCDGIQDQIDQQRVRIAEKVQEVLG